MKTMNSYLRKEVVLLGTKSKFGRMASFLLKQCQNLNKLTLYDDKNIKVFNDIEYIDNGCNVKFCNGKEKLSEAVKTGDIIIIGDDGDKEANPESTLLRKAPIISDYLRHITCYNSNAIILVATAPVNMVLPFVAETLKNLGHCNERKLFGLTNIENMKARYILAAHLRINPRAIDFPVIGGSSSETRVPLLSKISPTIQLSKQDLNRITCSVKTSEIKLSKEKECQESLIRAYATAMLIQSIVSALNGKEVIETVLSYQNVIKDSDYFSLPVVIGKEGIKDHISFSNISYYEKNLLSHSIKCMAADAKIGKKYSEKIRKNTTNIIPPNKLSSLVIPSLYSSTNLKSRLETQQSIKPLECTQSKSNLPYLSKNSLNNEISISNISAKNISAKNISAIHQFTFPDSETIDDVIIEVKKYCDDKKNKRDKPLGKNKDLNYALSGDSLSISKLPGNQSAKSISVDKTNSVNSGLNNFKIFKRHYKQVAYYRKKLDSYNTFPILSSELSKKPSVVEVISLSRYRASCPAENELRPSINKGILSKAAAIQCITKLKPTAYRHVHLNGVIC